MEEILNKELIAIENSIYLMGDTPIDDVDTALKIVEIKDKVTQGRKAIHEALSKVVVYTKEEIEVKKKLELLSGAERELFEKENEQVLQTVRAKDKKYQEKATELGDKPFKVELPKISKSKLPSGLKLFQYDALKKLII